MRFLISAAVVAACLFAGWRTFEWSDSVGPPRDAGFVRREMPPLTVEVMRPVVRTLSDRVELIGSLEAAASIDVRAMTPGYITKITREVGDTVKAGEVLLELDDTAAASGVVAAESEVTVAEKELEAERARVRFAALEVARAESLAATGVSTAQQLEEAESELALAEAAEAVAEARVASAKANLEHAHGMLEQVTIRAPFGGLVASRDADPGDLATTDRSLLSLIAIETVRTVVAIGERDYAKVTVGNRAELQVDSYPDRVFEGVVVRVAPLIDAQTRTAQVEIDVANPRGVLKPGMTTRVVLTLGERAEATAVPVASVMEEAGRSTLMVVDGDPPAAEVREVVTGVSDGGFVEIVKGLFAGDRVVTLGNHVAADGDEVVPVEVADASAAIRAAAEAGGRGVATP
ncbi:MAG: efflux RND transporter periplasmic adaptor subunit [Planctomycetota bacterium]